jgi:hypothetical protein
LEGEIGRGERVSKGTARKDKGQKHTNNNVRASKWSWKTARREREKRKDPWEESQTQ